MDIALVTGAERGVGLRISQKLITLGFRVYGLAQDFSKCHFAHQDFIRLNCDLCSREALVQAWEQIAERETVILALIHAATHEPADPFEAAGPEEIEYTLMTGLVGPAILTRLALPRLMRYHGHVISLAWPGHGHLRGGPAAAAAGVGLHHLTQQIFNEVRDTGVKLCTLHPQPNPGPPDPQGRINLHPQSEVDNGLIADAVETILQFRGHNNLSQIVVQPQGTREKPHIATSVPDLRRAAHDVILPPIENFPKEPEPIPTPERKRPADAPPPEAIEEEDDEDDDLDLLIEESRNLLRQQREAARNKLAKTEKRGHRVVPKPAPAEPTPTPPPEPELTEEEKQAAEEARRRFAALLGLEPPETDPDINLVDDDDDEEEDDDGHMDDGDSEDDDADEENAADDD